MAMFNSYVKLPKGMTEDQILEGKQKSQRRQHRLVGRPAVSNHPQSQFQSEPPRRDHRVHEYQMEYQMEALWSFDETNDQAGILKNQKISMHPKDPKETRNRHQKFPYTFVWKFPLQTLHSPDEVMTWRTWRTSRSRGPFAADPKRSSDASSTEAQHNSSMTSSWIRRSKLLSLESLQLSCPTDFGGKLGFFMVIFTGGWPWKQWGSIT